MKAFSIILSVIMAGAVLWFGGRFFAGIPDWDHGLLTIKETPLPTHDKDGRPLISCPDCQGTGQGPCQASKCLKGLVQCPQPCLKLTVGDWEKLKVKDHDPELVWQVVRKGNTWRAWSQEHVGELIQEVNGELVNTGKCSACAGTTMVACPQCLGSAKGICGICKGIRVLLAPKKTEQQKEPEVPSPAPVIEIQVEPVPEKLPVIPDPS